MAWWLLIIIDSNIIMSHMQLYLSLFNIHIPTLWALLLATGTACTLHHYIKLFH